MIKMKVMLEIDDDDDDNDDDDDDDKDDDTTYKDNWTTLLHLRGRNCLKNPWKSIAFIMLDENMMFVHEPNYVAISPIHSHVLYYTQRV